MKNLLAKKSEWLWAWIFIAPTIIGLIFLNIIPIFQTAYLSFFKTGAFGKGNIYVGLDNYIKMVKDPQVWMALKNTFTYAIFEVPITLFLALIIAALINSNIKGKGLFRVIYFLPMVAIPAAVTLVWSWLFNANFGLFNQILSSLGFSKVDWIQNTETIKGVVITIGVWSNVGYAMILLLAGMQEIPNDYYEAARIDGASPIKQFFTITIPLVSPTLYFVLTTSIIRSLQAFDIPYMLIQPGVPSYDSAVSVIYLFYMNSFRFNQRGAGAALMIFMLVIIMIITFINSKIQKKWVHYM